MISHGCDELEAHCTIKTATVLIQRTRNVINSSFHSNLINSMHEDCGRLTYLALLSSYHIINIIYVECGRIYGIAFNYIILSYNKKLRSSSLERKHQSVQEFSAYS